MNATDSIPHPQSRVTTRSSSASASRSNFKISNNGDVPTVASASSPNVKISTTSVSPRKRTTTKPSPSSSQGSKKQSHPPVKVNDTCNDTHSISLPESNPRQADQNTSANATPSIHSHQSSKSNTAISILLQSIHSAASAMENPPSRLLKFLDVLVDADGKRYSHLNLEEVELKIPSIYFLSILLATLLVANIIVGDGTSRGIAPLSQNYMIGPSAQAIYFFGGNDNYFIKQSFNTQGWRLIAAGFLHLGFVHLIINLACLYVLLPKLDAWYGQWRVALFFVVSSIGAQFTSCIMHTANVVSVGASGAICGLMGVILADCFKNYHAINHPRTQLGYWLFQTLIFLSFGYIPMFDNLAHSGGLFTGFALGILLVPSLVHRDFHLTTSSSASPLSVHPRKPISASAFLGGWQAQVFCTVIALAILGLWFVGGSLLLSHQIDIASQSLCYAFLSLKC